MRAVLLLQLVAGAWALLQAPREGNNFLSTRDNASKELKDDAALEQQGGHLEEGGKKEKTRRRVEHLSEVLAEASAGTDVKNLKAALRLAAEAGVKDHLILDEAEKKLESLQKEEKNQREKELKMTREEKEQEEDEALETEERRKIEEDKKRMEEDRLILEERKRKRQEEEEEDRRKMEEDKKRVEEDQLKLEEDHASLERQRRHGGDASATLAKASAGTDVKAKKRLDTLQEEHNKKRMEEYLKLKERRKIEENKKLTEVNALKLAEAEKHKTERQKAKEAAESAKTESKRLYSEALAKALTGGDVKTLKAAFKPAAEAGVNFDLLAEAETKIATLQEEEDKKRRLEEDKQRTEEDQLKLLKLKESRKAEEDRLKREEAEEARKRTRVNRAYEALVKAMAGRDFKTLKAALKWAAQSGVDFDFLATAKKKIAILQEAQDKQQMQEDRLKLKKQQMQEDRLKLKKHRKTEEDKKRTDELRLMLKQTEAQKTERQKAKKAVDSAEIDRQKRAKIEGLEQVLAGARKKLDYVQKLKTAKESKCSVSSDRAACQTRVKQMQDNIAKLESKISGIEQVLQASLAEIV